MRIATVNGTRLDAIEKHPIVQDIIDSMREDILEESKKPHTHTKLVKRNWFARWILRREYYKSVEIPCTGRLVPDLGPGKTRIEFDAETISWRVVLWHRFQCLSPCIPDDTNRGKKDFYAASKISARQLESANVSRETSP